jgi:hypothetical protein
MEEKEPRLVLRPVTSPSAVEHARRMAELGVDRIEERADGRVWVEGPDRRKHPREESGEQLAS